MEKEEKSLSTVRRIISMSYGAIATQNSPVPYEKMPEWEKECVLEPYQEMIAEDIRLIGLVMDQERSIATGRVFSHFRNAEGVDAEMIDQIMATESLEPGKLPVGGM